MPGDGIQSKADDSPVESSSSLEEDSVDVEFVERQRDGDARSANRRLLESRVYRSHDASVSRGFTHPIAVS